MKPLFLTSILALLCISLVSPLKDSYQVVLAQSLGIHGQNPRKYYATNNPTLFKATSMNWDLVSLADDFLDKQVYDLSYQGDLSYYEVYNKTGIKHQQSVKISKHDLDKINKLIKNQIQDEEEVEACDGTGWIIDIYDQDRNHLFSYTGYIYETYKEEVIEILDTYIHKK